MKPKTQLKSKFRASNSNLLVFPAVLALSMAGFQQAQAQTYAWDGNGNSNTGGDWSTGANWNPDLAGGPVTTADLVDVTTGTRTVNYDALATGTLSTLLLNQATAGATNELLLLKNLTVSNAITVGTAAGTERIIIGSTPSISTTFTPSGGLTINSGGEVAMTATVNTAATGFNLGNLGGSTTTTTVAGGTLTLSPTSGTGFGSSVQNTITGNFVMTSGLINIDNATGLPDHRLQINGNATITGGAISATKSSGLGALFFNGPANIFNPASFEQYLSIQLAGVGNQTFASGILLNSLTAPVARESRLSAAASTVPTSVVLRLSMETSQQPPVPPPSSWGPISPWVLERPSPASRTSTIA